MFFVRMFIMQTKKYLKSLPVALLSATGFLIMFIIIFYSATKLMPEDQPILKANVGLVTNGLDDDTLKWGLRFLNGTESISEHLEFKVMDEQQGEKALKNGKIIGLVILPENVLEGILYGYNYPATIKFNKNNPLSNVILTELTKSGATLLSGAQSSTYTAGELYQTLDISNELPTAFDDIDIMQFRYALSRQKNFYSKDNNKNDFDSIIVFYVFAAFTLLLLITTMCFSKETFYDNDAVLLFGMKKRSFNILYPLSKIISMTCIYSVILLIFTLLTGIFIQEPISFGDILIDIAPKFSIFTIISIFIISLFLAAYSHMLIFMTDTVLDGTLLIFIVSIILTFISGMIVPLSFMPPLFSSISIYSPASQIQNILISIFTGSSSRIIYLFLYAIICIFITTISFIIRCRKKI